MYEQSEQLTEFYRAYRDWSVDPKNSPIFNKHAGLCNSLHKFCEYYGYSSQTLRLEMERQFTDNNLNIVYPFNNRNSYMFEHDNGLMLQNVKRLLWVNEHC